MENSKAGVLAGEMSLKQRVIDCNMFGPGEIAQITKETCRDTNKFNELCEAVTELSSKREYLNPSAVVKLGVCQFLIGEIDAAKETLETGGDKSALDLYYRALIALGSDDCQAAVDAFDAAERAGYDKGRTALGRAEAHRNAGLLQESLADLDSISGEIEQTADYLYQRGATTAAIGDDPDQMLRWYERAHDRDGNHPGALFGMAIENERRGNDEEALTLYKRLSCLIPTHVGALINLGLLYEDHEKYEEAVACYRRVLNVDPTNVKAQMYLKDAEASLNRGGRGSRIPIAKLPARSVYDKPVSDFELSSRARKALQTMGIELIGDLCAKTEKELLSTKNFGDSSLSEIKQILESLNLKLGSRDVKSENFEDDVQNLSEMYESNDNLRRPVDDLNLTVRAKKCLTRKDIRTIGELVSVTAEELLSSKNFGVTSLNEIKRKLEQFGLKLKGE